MPQSMKMHLTSRVLLLTLFVLFCETNLTSGSHATIKLEDNGYSGILVAFDPNIQERHREELVQKTKDLLQSASKQLFESTQSRLFFREITFLIPKGWKIAGDFDQIAKPIYQPENGDILITDKASVRGDNIHTLQYGGCGKLGKRIYLTQSFLLDENASRDRKQKVKSIVREWAHYRYGVFNEFGHTEDPVYPAYYSLPGTTSVKLTDCAASSTGKQLRVTTNNLNGHSAPCELTIESSTGLPKKTGDTYCYPLPVMRNLSVNAGVVSSLMFSSDLPNVDHFCDKSNHNKEAPNKHNLMCDGLSVWETFNKHQDFISTPNSKSSAPFVKFTRVDVTEPPTVILADISSDANLKHGQRANDIHEIIKTFSAIGVEPDRYEFKSSSKVEKTNRVVGREDNSPIQLNQVLLDSIITQDEPHTAAKLIIITRGLLQDSEKDVEEMTRTILSQSISLRVIVFPYNKNLDLQRIKSLVLKTKGELELIPEKVRGTRIQVETRMELYRALIEYGSKSYRQLLVKQQTFKNQPSAIFNFPVDQSIIDSKSQLVAFLFSDSRASFSEMVSTLRLSDGQTSYGYQRLRDVAFIMESKDLKTGTWTLTATLPNKPDEGYLAGAFIIPSNVDDLIDVSCYLSTDELEIVSDENNNLIAYTFVSRSEFGYVQDAKVILTLYDTTGNSVDFEMADDGYGDPDITKGDGIYSVYIDGLQSGRFYKAVAKVKSTENTKVVKTNSKSSPNVDASECCESFIPSKNANQVEFLERQKDCGGFYLNVSQTAKPPLGSVRNLKMKTIDLSKKRIYFTFKGPFGNVKVVEYRFFKSSEKEYMTPEKFSTNAKLNWNYFIWDYDSGDGNPPKLSYGEEIPVNFDFPYTEAGEYYFAMKTTGDGRNPVTKISNPVVFYINEGSISTEPGSNTNCTTTCNLIEGGIPKWLIIVLIVMLVLLLLFVCIFCVYLWAKKKKEKKPVRHEVRHENHALSKSTLPKAEYTAPQSVEPSSILVVKENDAISPVQSWPADVLLNHYSEVQRAKARNEPPPIMTLESLDMSENPKTPSSKSNFAFEIDATEPNISYSHTYSTTSETSSDYDPSYGVVRKHRNVTQV